MATEAATTSSVAPPPNNQPTATRTTPTATSTAPATSSAPTTNGTDPNNLFASTTTNFAPAAERNILNSYRSVNYRFTLGVLPPEAVAGGSSVLETNLKKFLVLDSAGKGQQDVEVGQTVGLTTATNRAEVEGLVQSFNNNSAGRFDMFIDDVAIDGIIGAGTNQAGPSIATNVEFTVFEPYSMNGFMQAMQVCSQAAGYPDYQKAVFALRVQFHGYPDNSDTPAPMVVPASTRYFILTITEVTVDVTESGTRYQVKAVPTNQTGFGTPNILISDIKVNGTYVWEVLRNLFKAVNDAAIDNAKRVRGETNVRADIYEISCPTLATEGHPEDVKAAMLYSPRPEMPFTTATNAFQHMMIQAKMNDELKEVNVFQTGDPAQFANGYDYARPAGATTPTDGAPAAAGTTPAASTPTTTGTAPTTPASAPASSSPTATSSASTGTATSNPATGRLVPSSGTVVFAQGRQLHECIAAVIRDSTYVRDNVLKTQLDAAKQPGSDKMVTYFTVRMEIELQPEFDPIQNKYFCVYRYVLEPYRMLYNRIPGQEQGVTDHTPVLKKLKREYNYIYTGKNVDVLKFQLKFDSLYFTAFPKNLGNRNEVPATTQAAGPANTPRTQAAPSAAAPASSNPTPGATGGTVTAANPSSTASATTPASAATGPQSPQALPTPSQGVDSRDVGYQSNAAAGQTQSDPFYAMARAMHTAVLNNVDMIQGTLEILGDPYFLVTGGMGNQDLAIAAGNEYVASDGQAPTTQGDLFININFRNPIDINVGGKDSGLLRFDQNLLPFSGVYRITELKSRFKGGIFTQEIQVLRSPGQVIGDAQNPEAVAPSVLTTPSSVPGTQIRTDSRPLSVLAAGIKKDAINFGNIVQRGLPNIGLPGVPTNFTNSVNALNAVLAEVTSPASWTDFKISGVAGGTLDLEGLTGKVVGAAAGAVSEVSGAVNEALSKIGNLNPSQQQALKTTVNNLMSQAAGDVTNVLNEVTTKANGVLTQVSGAVGQIDALANQLGTDPIGGLNPLTSGISISPSTLGEITNVTNQAAATINSAGQAIGNLAGIADSAVGLASNVADSLSSIPNLASLPQEVASLVSTNAASLVGGVKDAVNKLQNTIPTDTSAIASRLGIDPGKLAGLDPALASKVTEQLAKVAELVPENANLQKLSNIGVMFRNITAYQLPNLPPFQPETIAPSAIKDPALNFISDFNGSVQSILDGAANLPALTDLNNVSNSLGNLTAGLSGGLGSAVDSITGQVSAIQGQVDGVLASAQGVVNQVGSLTQNSIGAVNAATAKMGSVESVAASVNSIAQTAAPAATKLASTVNAQFGSIAAESPLTTLVKNSNIQGSIT